MGGDHGLPIFLPHSPLLLPIADGKANAPPCCRGGSATEESEVEASWVVWCIHLQDCLLVGDSSCVFAEIGFNFLLQWAKWWVEFASHSCLVVFRAWLLSESLFGCQESSVHPMLSVRPEAWPQAIPEAFQLLCLLLTPISDSSTWISSLKSQAAMLSLYFGH